MTDTAVRHPAAGPCTSRWRSAVAAALVLAAGCGGGSPTAPGPAPDLPPDEPAGLAARTGRDLPPDELAGEVALRLVSEDFAEPPDERLAMEVRGDLLFARGVVNRNSRREAVALLNRSPGVRTLVLTWVPGSVNDEVNLALGRALREAGMTTYLPREGMVASGGTDLLLAGARRIVECGALVGVHSWAFGPVGGNELPRDDPRHRFYLDYYREIDIPEAFYWFTLEAAPPDSIHWMTGDEMAHYGVHTHLSGPCGRGSSATRTAAADADPRAHTAYRGAPAREPRSGVHATGSACRRGTCGCTTAAGTPVAVRPSGRWPGAPSHRGMARPASVRMAMCIPLFPSAPGSPRPAIPGRKASGRCVRLRKKPVKKADGRVPPIRVRRPAPYGLDLPGGQIRVLDGAVLRRTAHRRPLVSPEGHGQNGRCAPSGPCPEQRPEVSAPARSDHDHFEGERAGFESLAGR